MTSSRTIIRSRSAIALGLMFAATTAFVMFADVKSIDHITPDHVTTAMILLGTIYAGHMIWPLLKTWRTWGHAAALAVLFAVGTWYCVVSSAGRNAESASAKASVVDAANGVRERAARTYVDASTRYKAALAAETEECKSGEGKNCRANRKTTELRRTELLDADKAYREAPPERIANGTNKQAARVFAVFLPLTEHELEVAVGLLMPFAKAMFLEIATLILLGIGLGHESVRVFHSVPAETPKALSFERPLTDDEIEQIRRILTGRKAPVTNDELAALAGVTKSEMSKRVQKAHNAGIIEKLKAGRYSQISLVA